MSPESDTRGQTESSQSMLNELVYILKVRGLPLVLVEALLGTGLGGKPT